MATIKGQLGHGTRRGCRAMTQTRSERRVISAVEIDFYDDPRRSSSRRRRNGRALHDRVGRTVSLASWLAMA